MLEGRLRGEASFIYVCVPSHTYSPSSSPLDSPRYLRENHNSVLGIREYAMQHGGHFEAVGEGLEEQLCTGGLRFCLSHLKHFLTFKMPNSRSLLHARTNRRLTSAPWRSGWAGERRAGQGGGGCPVCVRVRLEGPTNPGVGAGGEGACEWRSVAGLDPSVGPPPLSPLSCRSPRSTAPLEYAPLQTSPESPVFSLFAFPGEDNFAGEGKSRGMQLAL